MSEDSKNCYLEIPSMLSILRAVASFYKVPEEKVYNTRYRATRILTDARRAFIYICCIKYKYTQRKTSYFIGVSVRNVCCSIDAIEKFGDVYNVKDAIDPILKTITLFITSTYEEPSVIKIKHAKKTGDRAKDLINYQAKKLKERDDEVAKYKRMVRGIYERYVTYQKARETGYARNEAFAWEALTGEIEKAGGFVKVANLKKMLAA
jgi:hypothetical protein